MSLNLIIYAFELLFEMENYADRLTKRLSYRTSNYNV